jgi:ferric-dicitrate binding protein FerR (iron transport regulator)
MEAVDKETALRKLKVRLNKRRTLNVITVLQKMAAVLIVPLLIFALWQGNRLTQFSGSVVQNRISTPPAMRSEFVLPDGTKVYVNGGTSISYPTHFTGNERLVDIEGEAYFEVAPNNKPFLVKAGNIYVEATGTEFNVLAYPTDHKVETVLTEGEVNILHEYAQSRQRIVTLQPGQMASFDKESGKFVRSKVDTYKYIAWKDGALVFRNDYLSDVISRLGRWYNVDFIVDPDLETAYAFTGTFKNEELSQILGYIELTTPVHFEIMKKTQDHDNIYGKTQIKIKAKK